MPKQAIKSGKPWIIGRTIFIPSRKNRPIYNSWCVDWYGSSFDIKDGKAFRTNGNLMHRSKIKRGRKLTTKEEMLYFGRKFKIRA